MSNLSTPQRIIVLLLSLGGVAATSITAPDPAVVAEAEKSFARAGLERGIRESFLEYFSEDSIVFAPGPVSGKTHYTEYKEKGLALVWQPAFATIARSGDLGVTTGPWHIKKSRTDSDAIAYGEFVSVWKLQPDRSWKVAFDTGVGHERPPPGAPELQLAKPKLTEGGIHDGSGWPAAEKEFKDRLAIRGAKGLVEFADKDIRVLREDSFPIVGKENAEKILVETKMNRQAAGGAISLSGDLAYRYGSYSAQQENGVIESGYCITIWQAGHDGTWKIILDLQKKTPPGAQ